MKDPRHFADFFNGYIYYGKEVIRPEQLSEVDTSSIAMIPYKKGENRVSVQKYRDIIKKALLMQSDTSYYLFLGIENQSEIHYAMPVRIMLYNALVYNQQVEAIKKYNHDHCITADSDEFLSGMTKADKLIPVVTVTVYWGTKPWDGPTRLKEMLTYVDENAAELVDDINCNLFSIIDAENMPEFKTELNELFQLLAKRNNKDAMLELLSQNEKYQNIDKDTAYMMREYANIKLPRKSKKGGYNMCKAIEDLKKECMDRGIEQGIEAFVLDKIEDQYPKDEIIKKLVKRFSLLEAEAVEYFEKYSSVLV